MARPEYQTRVITEKSELDEKRQKLQGFIDGDKFAEVDADEQDRLERQSAIMQDYSDVLEERITAFPPEDAAPEAAPEAEPA